MNVHLSKPVIRRNWKAVGVHLGQALLEAGAANIPNVVTHLRSALGGESLAEQSTDERAYTWLAVSLASAVRRALDDDRIGPPVESQELSRKIAAFLEDAMQLDGSEALDHAALINPASAPVLKNALDQFHVLVRGVNAGCELTEKECSNLLRDALRIEAPRVYALDIRDYKPVVDALTGPVAEGARRELAWARHADWIRGLYERDPIFGQEPESGISLEKVYIRLRCYWHTEKTPDPDEGRDRDQRKKLTAHIGQLHETVFDWLENAPKSDCLRMVTGGPGCGKSSFARAFACEVNARGTHRVVFIPLQRIGLGGDLKDRLGKELYKRWSELKEEGGAGFPSNPLDWIPQEERPILLIFDGLDEFTPSEDRAEDLTRKFVSAVHDLARGLSDVRAVVLGRPAACQEALKAAEFDLNRNTLLHVAPLTPITDEVVGKSGYREDSRGEVVDISDHAGLMTEDQREAFWRRWARVDGADPDIVPEAVTHRDMGELNAEPLLLYLLIWSGFSGERWREASDNRNVVYRAIFAKVFERNKDKEHLAAAKLDEGDFFDLMECLGLAAWRGNGRTGTDEDFDRLRNLHLRHKRRKLEGVQAAKLRNVAVNFYTRADIGEAEGFEFIHKSFGEYLAARGLINAALRFARNLRDEERGLGADDIARDWVALIADAELSEQVIRFARDETRLIAPTLSEEIHMAKDALTGVYNWSLRHGFPAQVMVGDAFDFRSSETRQRCCEAAFLLALSSLCQSLPAEGDDAHRLDIDWIDTGAARDTMDRIQATHFRLARLLFARANLIRADLGDADLGGANLSGANLGEANLIRAKLGEADLGGANLGGANLSGANLIRANLSGANLIRADLGGANLIRAKLGGANLSGANLIRANLSGANLIRADLGGANLGGANLSGANLIRADLGGANLSGANLSGAKLGGANLSGANLIRANLSGANLIRADLGGANLSGANLSGAKLIRADLGGANLSGANLSGANLSGADLGGADCSRMRIDSARLQSAELSLAQNLKQSQIDEAEGDEHTRLPDGLARPSHWPKVD